ncbi:MAG: hemopexin repeat-containing protein [Ardenticatenaceae bacterium]
MTTENKQLLPLPGVEVVGRGVYLSPRQPYALKGVLFKQDKKRTYYSKETSATFYVPEGYEINDSPPMPSKQALNQTVIEESWEHLDDQLSMDSNMAAGNAMFSIDANASQATQLRTDEEAYYALRSSFIPLWTAYIPNSSRFSEKTFEMDLPVPFEHDHRREYERFFDQYGTHYVRRVWVGGKATLAFTIAKSSEMTKEDIQAGLKASVVTQGSGHMNASLKNSQDKLQNNSECTVFGKGGDELKLAALSSLDEAAYNEWLATIKHNPQVIELEVVGIWTLISDKEKAKALQEAYKEATTFTPVSSVFNIRQQVYFLRRDKYFFYHLETHESEKPKPIGEKWPFLRKIGFLPVDAALRGDHLFSPSGENLSHKLFLFRKHRCICIDLKSNEIEEGYPKLIAEAWPGLKFDRIDAILDDGPEYIYFFKGPQYVRYNVRENKPDRGYPKPISKRWAGVTFDRIDAAISWGGIKAYFFRKDQYIRYDMVTYRADPGYPKFIIGSYVEDMKFFE